MEKRIRDYVKYTLVELENYTKAEGSCVKKINSIWHLSFPPYGLGNIHATLLKIINSANNGSLFSQTLEYNHLRHILTSSMTSSNLHPR